jgi:type II secretory pathway component PulJ
MKRLIAVAIMALGLVGVSVGLASAHHNTQHSQGPCGPYPCPKGDGK